MAPAITAALTRRDSRIHVRYVVMPTIIRDTLVQDRLLASLSGGFGVVAALLTMVGLYGLVAYAVTRRTAEIGIRMALGATRGDIARLLVGETGLLLAIGAACGVGLAVAGGRFAAALLFQVQPHDPVSLAGAVALLSLIAVCASVFRLVGRRASIRSSPCGPTDRVSVPPRRVPARRRTRAACPRAAGSARRRSATRR